MQYFLELAVSLCRSLRSSGVSKSILYVCRQRVSVLCTKILYLTSLFKFVPQTHVRQCTSSKPSKKKKRCRWGTAPIMGCFNFKIKTPARQPTATRNSLLRKRSDPEVRSSLILILVMPGGTLVLYSPVAVITILNQQGQSAIFKNPAPMYLGEADNRSDQITPWSNKFQRDITQIQCLFKGKCGVFFFLFWHFKLPSTTLVIE